ncbi:hypothetical protein Ccrd_012819 [Cynara cardunculus var. scolymus]|uniref:Uncharacterized protein n=1 Tax=Cynara cardunculus var. scolymus TaxID=59895 RepID=A0A103YGR8_CYNCS|nr:hypothetical protein Ccrd_012819 [Cynara cardunculus var. scolymus]
MPSVFLSTFLPALAPTFDNLLPASSQPSPSPPQMPCSCTYFRRYNLRYPHAFLYQTGSVAAVVVPPTNCYVLDNSSHIYDFVSYFYVFCVSVTILKENMSSWLGLPFEYDGGDTDYAVRFCKDMETRSQPGYVGFGRFDDFNYFVAGSGHYDFVQEFYNGDLQHCEKSHDKRGRTSQLNIICGDCPNGRCKGGLECVCNVTLESDCRMIVDLAIPCEKPGLRVFEGSTVGFHPRTWEIVYNGMTQYGYEKAYKDFSFQTDQSHVSLYMTAIASLSHLVQKPSITVSPQDGLEVTLSGSAATTGSRPTTLSPTLLNIDWRCETAHDSPYEHGIDALPGMTILSACLEILSGVGGGPSYMRPEDVNDGYTSQASWTREAEGTPGSSRTSERTYGT